MRIALTGGSTGIGAEVAAKLKAAGHHVTAFDISKPDVEVDIWIKTDLSDPTSIAQALDVADGPFDGLVNNAGLPPRDGLTEKIVQVNYIGLVAFMDGMLDKLAKDASIVSTASRAGAMWRENLDEVKALMALNPADLTDFIAARGIDPTRAYNLTKEAVIVMTQARTPSMHAKGIRINSVSPAAVSTGILDDFVTAFGDKVEKNLARVGRPGHPEEVADVILFLISPQSNWIRGQDIVIDGGMSAMAFADTAGL